MLVSSLVGLNSRATMDIDATVQVLPLTQEDIEKIINEIGVIVLEDNVSFERETLKTAFLATCEKRDTVFTSEQMQTVLEDIGSDMEMRERWNQFKKNNYYVEELHFDEVMDSVQNLVVSFL